MTSKNNTAFQLTNLEQHGFGTDAMKKIKVCTNCGQVANASKHFCKACGKRLPKESLFQSYKHNRDYCSFCDTVVNPHMHYCPICGKKLK